MDGNQLIFAPLVRVSTESQAKKGESLNTQKKQLESSINSLSGRIFKWYMGPEHATPNQERKILEELIRDAESNKFNAVMVADLSRWSRDNQKSKKHLEILRKNGVCFFILTKEFDLNDPSHKFMVGMGVEVAEFFAQEQANKSILNRIERAKAGLPSCGKLPFGRIFDKKTGEWDINKEIKNRINEIARLYLQEDIGFSELGQRFGMNPSNLCKILKDRCGTEWVQRFRNKATGIDESVRIQIPPLLPKTVIMEIRAKCLARRTWDHKPLKNEYLFSRMIFDMISGYALTGTPNAKGIRYYRPYKKNQKIYMVNADHLERMVLSTFFEALGSNNNFSEAVFSGNKENVLKKLTDDGERNKKELALITKNIERSVKVMLNYTGNPNAFFSKAAHKEIAKLEERQSLLQSEIEKIEDKIISFPSEELVEKKRKMTYGLLQSLKMNYLSSGVAFDSLPFKEKQKIVKLIFGGIDSDGKRYGIFIKPLEGKPKKYKFKATGRLGNIHGWMTNQTTWTDSTVDASEIMDSQNTISLNEVVDIIGTHHPYLLDNGEKNKVHIFCKCHAHHGLGLHQ